MTPRPYQLVGRDWLASKRHALLADEMRVGKTPQAILAAQAVGARNILVICPAIARHQWQREWALWCGRGAAVLEFNSWHWRGIAICSYDRATRMLDVLTKQRWDLVIVDECHYAKNPDAKRTKAVYGKAGLAHSADRVWALSGTPAPRDASDLWPMLYTFGVTKQTRSEFVSRYCVVDELGKVKGTKVAMIPELKCLMSPIMLRRKRSEVAPDMPAIDFQFLSIKPKNAADYRVPDGLGGDALLTWLEAHRGQSAETRQEVAAAKVEPLVEEIIEDFKAGLTAAVVFAYHISPLKEVARRLGEAGLSSSLLLGETSSAARVRIQDEFRGGKIQVIVAQIIAAGTAIDLSTARHAYFLELDWLPASNVQAANRLVNMEKADKVTADILTWQGSHDDIIQRVLVKRTRELSELY